MTRGALLHLLRSQSPYFSSSGDCLVKSRPWRHTFGSNIVANSTIPFTQRRTFSQVAEDNKISIGPRKAVAEGDEEKDIAYTGPISSTIKKVKLLSLSTCCLSVSLGPVVTFMTSQDTNVILKGAVASSVIFFSASTTAMLNWFVSPYIHKIRWKPGSDSVDVEVMTWLATFMTRTVKFADIRAPETRRPYVSFQANDRYYFVDADRCHNKALLAKLTPQKQSHASTFKNL